MLFLILSVSLNDLIPAIFLLFKEKFPSGMFILMDIDTMILFYKTNEHFVNSSYVFLQVWNVCYSKQCSRLFFRVYFIPSNTSGFVVKKRNKRQHEISSNT